MKKVIFAVLLLILIIETEASSRLIIHNPGQVVDTSVCYNLPLTIQLAPSLFTGNKLILTDSNNSYGDTLQQEKLNQTADGLYNLKIYEDLTTNAGNFHLGNQFVLKIGNYSIPIKTRVYNHTYHPGIVFYDAKVLENVVAEPKNDSLHSLGVAILKYYKITTLDGLKSNQYFNGITISDANLLNEPITNGGEGISPASSIKSNSLSEAGQGAVGGLSVTRIADGFAKFIVERTKQELSISFFDRFKEELNSYPDLKTLFPQTYRTLSAIGEDIYLFEAYIMALREAFESDLSSLPTNLPTIVENHAQYFDRNPELKAELLTVFYLTEAVQYRQHPGEMIGNIDPELFDSTRNVKPAIQTLQLISRSLRGNNDSVYWLSFTDIKRLLNDDTLFKIYLGLVYQIAKDEDITFYDKNHRPIILADKLKKENISLNDYKAYISNFAQKVVTIEGNIDQLGKGKNDSLNLDRYYNIVSSTIDILKYSLGLEKLLNGKSDSMVMVKEVSRFFDLAQVGADLAVDVNRRNYSSAIVNCCQLISYIDTFYYDSRKEELGHLQRTNQNLKSKYDESVKKAVFAKQLKSITDTCRCSSVQAMEQASKKYQGTDISLALAMDVAKGISLDKNFLDTLNKQQMNDSARYVESLLKVKSFKATHTDTVLGNASQQILKYGSFMSAVVQARTSDDVEDAIEAIALPAGSACIKRESAFNVALNAYCGLNLYEYNLTYKKNYFGPGVTAPIGITVSSNLKTHSSFSVFGSLVDIGALASFRFINSDSILTDSTIHLKDIFSPGIYFSWGIPKSPISINVGYQIVPLLGEVSLKGNTFMKRASRVGVSICVDLPLLNLYTSQRFRTRIKHNKQT